MSEMGLKTVHVFPSEESYQQNIASVKETDLSLVPFEGIDEDAIKKIVLNIFFPVGSTYMSADNAFNPNTAWGGTWAKIENRFLLGSGSRAVGAQGGEENVTLTKEQIPSHSHTAGSINMTGGMTAGRFHNWSVSVEGAVTEWNTDGGSGSADGSGWDRQGFRFDGSKSRNGSTGSAGSGNSHNNMPPYEVVNIWKRTA